MMNTFSEQLSWEALQLHTDDLYLSMGKNYVPDVEMEQMLAVMKNEIAEVCLPRFVYSFFDAESVEKNYVCIHGIKLHTGGVITPYLQQANQYVLFVVTAGTEFEQFQHSVKNSGDILREFLLDAYGTAIAEAIVREVCQRVEAAVFPMGWGISHPYSPGYCGWSVTQQHALFSLLPNSPCGVHLSESSLMSPIKSVSGIIAVGSSVTKRKYGCELCGKRDCYKNRNQLKD